jgi:threonine dehydratase
MPDITVTDVERARERIAGLVDPSPVVRSPLLAGRLGIDVWLKLENLHPPGSFKVRGAANKILALSDAERRSGVIASSAGNHGVAVAYVAQRLGIPATICLPETVDPIKLRAISRFGAETVVHGATFDEALRHSQHLQKERRLAYIHPFDDPHVIAGQGTIGLELLDQVPDLAAIVMAVSGGGLAGGIGLALKSRRPSVHVTGASARLAAAMVHSLRAGHPVDIPYQKTLAEVLTGGIGSPNRWSLDAVRRFVDDHVLVGEADIGKAMQFALSAHRVVVEGGGAVPLAAVLAGQIRPETGPLVIVVSGGNVDPATILALEGTL